MFRAQKSNKSKWQKLICWSWSSRRFSLSERVSHSHFSISLPLQASEQYLIQPPYSRRNEQRRKENEQIIYLASVQCSGQQWHWFPLQVFPISPSRTWCLCSTHFQTTKFLVHSFNFVHLSLVVHTDRMKSLVEMLGLGLFIAAMAMGLNGDGKSLAKLNFNDEIGRQQQRRGKKWSKSDLLADLCSVYWLI